MKFEKLDDPVPSSSEELVEATGMDGHRLRGRREIVEQRAERQFDHDDRRCLEWLDEAGAEPDGEAVPAPEFRPVTRRKDHTARDDVSGQPRRGAREIAA